MADIVLINPRFELSFWGFENCMRLFGKRANLPVAGLALLAALVPKHHRVTLLDENVEDIDFDFLGRADLVCLCEFCDIIVTLGRRPRLKTSQQVLAELECRLAGSRYHFRYR